MWTDLAIKLGISLAMKLLTDAFISRALVRGARAISEKTTNTLDDGMVDDLAGALGQEDLKKKAA
jgi:hypothetical protein